MNMMTIRKFVAHRAAVAVCSAALCATPMLAQGRGMTTDQRMDAIDKAVTLTADEKPQVRAILEADMKKMQDLRAAQDPDMRSKMMDMRKDENAKIRALLTDDQKPKFDEYVASQPAGGGRPGGGAPPQQ